MKKPYLFVASLLLCMLVGCSQEPISEDLQLRKSREKPIVITPPVETDASVDEAHCFTTQLLAGQHHVAGSVTMDIVGENIVITYFTNSSWTLGITHLSVGNCDEDWAPLNGGGNPQIGQFEYTEPYSTGPHEVVYIIPLAEFGDNFCFAAHAEVQGPTGGETAWAEGTQFPGNGWAMFVETVLSNCQSDGDGGGDGGGGDNEPT